MGYKDKEKQRAYQRANYQKNKELWRDKLRNRRFKNKQLVIELKKKGCTVCGYTKCHVALEFHHSENDKESSVAYAAHQSTMRVLLEEIDKCTLLCANCHRELHHKERMEELE
jgi:L-lysine 2,3-aminomutase